MKLGTHLIFNGQCEQAFKFYERILGGSFTMLTYRDSPMAEQVPAQWRSKVVHATLSVGDAALMGADVEDYQQPQGFYVLLSIDDPVDAGRIFRALAENGAVRMPIQKTFWSPAFGMLVDQFGIPWEISCEQTPTVA
jgi:PhnB protein